LKRFRIVYKEEAISDLQAIRSFIDQSFSGDSDTVINALVSRIRSLEYLAMSFRVRHPRKTPGLSIYAVVELSYVIYYRVDEREGIVRIQTVRHGARRQPRRFP
jgi:plasmid stabilization system protein ParE